MSLFSGKQDSYLGIDIGAGGIKLVELHKNKNRPQLWTYGSLSESLDIHVQKFETPPEPTAKGEPQQFSAEQDERINHYANLLKVLVKQARVSTNRTTASLPVSAVFHALITLPLVPEKEIEYHVNAKVEKMLPEPIADMQVVHQLIPDGKTEMGKKKFFRILVTAVPKRIISFYTAIFQRAGLELQELETEAFALERSLVGHDPATVMVIDMGAERTNFFIMDEGLPLTHRSIQLGGKSFDKVIMDTLSVDAKEVGQIKFDISHLAPGALPTNIFESSIDPIIKEIQYSFDLFLHQTGNETKRPEKIILTGGSALFPPVVAAIQEKFPLKVFVGDPWARVVYQQGLKPLLDPLGPRMSVAIGLALRNIFPS